MRSVGLAVVGLGITAVVLALGLVGWLVDRAERVAGVS